MKDRFQERSVPDSHEATHHLAHCGRGGDLSESARSSHSCRSAINGFTHDARTRHKLLFRNLNVEGPIDSSATTPGLSTASVLVTEVEAWSAGIVWAWLLAASRTMPKATVQRAFFRVIIGSSSERLFFGHIRLNRRRRHDHNRGAQLEQLDEGVDDTLATVAAAKGGNASGRPLLHFGAECPCFVRVCLGPLKAGSRYDTP